MRIIIVGGGVVGFNLAEHLRYEHHDISLIEKDQAIYEQIKDRSDIQILCGKGTSPRLLEAAGIKTADMLIAVTPVDEINILLCSMARQYGVETRIARIRSDEFRDEDTAIELSEMGVTLIIDPESVVVDSILHFVETPGASNAINFQDGNVLMRGYRVVEDMPVVGQPLSEIRRENLEHPLIFVAAIRDGTATIPDGDFVIKAGDEIFGIFPRSSLETYLNLFNRTAKDVKNIIISGASLTAVLLAEALEGMVEKVILIDPDTEHAQMAADRLNNVDIVNGDSTNSGILNEIYIRNADFFIAASKENEENVMSALLAKAEGASEVVAIITDTRHDQLYESIGIDHVIHPRLAIAREILEAIHHGHIGQIVQIRDLNIEAIRITAEENSPITGRPLRHVRSKIQKGSIISTVLRGDKMIIPDGNTVIEPGDQMIVITYSNNVSRVRKLFKSR